MYDLNELAVRVEFFNSLISFIVSCDCRDFIIFGDFNSVLNGDERWGINGFGSTSEELCNFVDALDFHDLSLLGSPFTFFGYGQSVTHSRIDKFLLSDGVLGFLVLSKKWLIGLSRIICRSRHLLRVSRPGLGRFSSSPFGAKINLLVGWSLTLGKILKSHSVSYGISYLG